MNDFMTTKEAAKLWNATEANVASFCVAGLIKADKVAGRWLISRSAQRPADLPALGDGEPCLPLGLGTKNFKQFSTSLYYVDKTLLLRDIIDKSTGYFLFTRPRRFGKSLNLDMIKTFFERTEEDNSAYFVDKKIWNCGLMYRQQQGQYPIIYVSFSGVDQSTWNEMYHELCKILTQEVDRHKELRKSKKCRAEYKKMVRSFTAKGDDRYHFEHTLSDLSRMLEEHYGIPAIIIIDEYDTPIQKGYTNGFYKEVVGFLRNLFCHGLKDNNHVKYGFLTGILQVAKESIFTGMNNLIVYSVLDPQFSAYFGYTSEEVRAMAVEYHAEDRIDEIQKWYNGYVFGGTEIYNPWSVVSYFEKKCEIDKYWLNTSGNELIGELVRKAEADCIDQLQDLLNGKMVRAAVDIRMVYSEIADNPSSIFSFLLACGYLKAVDIPPVKNGEICTLAIPNMEVLSIFKKVILDRFAPTQQAIAQDIQKALENNDWKSVRSNLQTFLSQSASYFDTSAEGFYHGFALGLSAAFAGYYITSNRESGDGRYDIEMEPKLHDHPGILIEFKSLDSEKYTKEKLHEEAVNALDQINKNNYNVNLLKRNIHTIYKYGIAFCGKHVDVVTDT